MTGTAEHGLKIQKAAEERELEPLAFCDELSQHFRVSGFGSSGLSRVITTIIAQGLAVKANISNTRFSRTTERDHHQAVHHLWVRVQRAINALTKLT